MLYCIKSSINHQSRNNARSKDKPDGWREQKKGRAMLEEWFFGTIRHFDIQKKRGYIIPDERLPGNKEVCFRRRDAWHLKEDDPGEVAFVFDSHVDREPFKGDRIVYHYMDGTQGPVATEWNYETRFKRVEEFINMRPWPECPLCRVVRLVQRPNHTLGKEVLWQGYYPRLLEMLHANPDDFKEEWYTTVNCEWLLWQGYTRMHDPRDTSFCEEYSMTQVQKIILQQFELDELARRAV